MPIEDSIIMSVDKCPWCHCDERVTAKAHELGHVELPTGVDSCNGLDVLKLNKATLVPGHSYCLLIYHDTCCRCGRDYVFKSVIKLLPDKIQTTVCKM